MPDAFGGGNRGNEDATGDYGHACSGGRERRSRARARARAREQASTSVCRRIHRTTTMAGAT